MKYIHIVAFSVLLALVACSKKSPVEGKWETTNPVVLEGYSLTFVAELFAEGSSVSGEVIFQGMPQPFVDEFGTKFTVLSGSFIDGSLEMIINPFSESATEKDAYKFELQLTEGQLVGFFTENDPADPDFKEPIAFTKSLR